MLVYIDKVLAVGNGLVITGSKVIGVDTGEVRDESSFVLFRCIEVYVI